MRCPFFALCLWLALPFLTCAADPATVLLGRWRAETVPTGYWVVDRYLDGRFAQKAFLVADVSKPAEIVFSWGRWKLRGKRYRFIIDGSTSAFIRRFGGRWKTTKVVSVRADRYDFLSSEGYPRYELPDGATGPLVRLNLTAPDDLSGANLTILQPDLRAVPPWVAASISR